MRILFDTQILIWAAEGNPRLPAAARALLLDPSVEALFSAASIWEVAIKSALGRPDFALDAALLAQGLARAGYRELAVAARHAAGVRTLPDHHRDPFDRLLAAQAAVERIVLVTTDAILARYPGDVRHVT